MQILLWAIWCVTLVLQLFFLLTFDIQKWPHQQFVVSSDRVTMYIHMPPPRNIWRKANDARFSSYVHTSKYMNLRLTTHLMSCLKNAPFLTRFHFSLSFQFPRRNHVFMALNLLKFTTLISELNRTKLVEGFPVSTKYI